MSGHVSQKEAKEHKGKRLEGKCERYYKLHKSSFPLGTAPATKFCAISGLPFIPVEVFNGYLRDREDGFTRYVVAKAEDMLKMAARLPVYRPRHTTKPGKAHDWIVVCAEMWEHTIHLLPEELEEKATSLEAAAKTLYETSQKLKKAAPKYHDVVWSGDKNATEQSTQPTGPDTV